MSIEQTNEAEHQIRKFTITKGKISSPSPLTAPRSRSTAAATPLPNSRRCSASTRSQALDEVVGGEFKPLDDNEPLHHQKRRSVHQPCAPGRVVLIVQPSTSRELRLASADAAEMAEGGRTYVFMPALKLPNCCTPPQTEALLCLSEHSGYATRLFLKEPVSGRGRTGRVTLSSERLGTLGRGTTSRPVCRPWPSSPNICGGCGDRQGEDHGAVARPGRSRPAPSPPVCRRTRRLHFLPRTGSCWLPRAAAGLGFHSVADDDYLPDLRVAVMMGPEGGNA